MNHRDMKALAENADAVQSLATYLMRLAEIDPHITWTDWELDFLAHMREHRGADPLSLRQVEVLVDLRDQAKSYATLDGLSIVSLINEVWLARFDLGEDDEQFIVTLKASGVHMLKRRSAMKLLGLARQLGIIERYVELSS